MPASYNIGGGVRRIGPGFSFAKAVFHAPFEQLTRPFAIKGVLQHAIDGRPPMQTDAQARLRWGEEPSFDIIDPTPATQPSVTVVWPNDPSQPDNQGLPDQVTIAATEIDRKTRTVRVTNPDDDTQYVDVEDVVKSLLRIDATGAPVYLSIDWLQRSGG